LRGLSVGELNQKTMPELRCARSELLRKTTTG
jgi:hypothetical protein